MKIKLWKPWLLAGALFLFSGILSLINKELFRGLMYTYLGVLDIYLSITIYKNNKSNPNEVSITAMTDVDAKIKELIAKGKKIEAVKYCRMATRIDLEKAKKYVDLLSKENLNR